MDKHDVGMEPSRIISATRHFWLLGAALLLSGCGWVAQVSQNLELRNYDRHIRNATQAIASARDRGEQAQAYSTRGTAYAEKARYSLAFKLIEAAEYDRLFEQAMRDHNQAIALNPENAKLYYNRGLAYWNRGTSEMSDHKDAKSWFDQAAADFEVSAKKDPRDYEAFDMLGLSYEQSSEWEQAIDAYTRELALNPKLGTARLADAYCGRGQDDARKMNLEAAAVDYEKSVELGSKTDDGCSCEPYDSLLVIYTQTGQYEKAWKFVHWAQNSKHWLDPELVGLLRKSSGRSS